MDQSDIWKCVVIFGLAAVLYTGTTSPELWTLYWRVSLAVHLGNKIYKLICENLGKYHR